MKQTIVASWNYTITGLTAYTLGHKLLSKCALTIKGKTQLDQGLCKVLKFTCPTAAGGYCYSTGFWSECPVGLNPTDSLGLFLSSQLCILDVSTMF